MPVVLPYSNHRRRQNNLNLRRVILHNLDGLKNKKNVLKRSSKESFQRFRKSRRNKEHFFDFNAISERYSYQYFRFSKSAVSELLEGSGLHDNIFVDETFRCSALEGLCMLLRRLSYPTRLTDFGTEPFHRSVPAASRIINRTLDFLHERYCERLRFDRRIINRERFEEYRKHLEDSGCPIHEAAGFIDGTQVPMCRPVKGQRAFYSGYKNTHGMRYQALVHPDGMVSAFSKSFSVKMSDSGVLRESKILSPLEEICKDENNEVLFIIYGDHGYARSDVIKTPPRGLFDLPHESPVRMFYKSMSSYRESVEWWFGYIKNTFKFIDFKKDLKILLQSVGKYVEICGLLANSRNVWKQNEISTVTGMQPTFKSIKEYLALDE